MARARANAEFRIPQAVFDQIELKITIQEDAERSRRFR